MQLQHLGSLQSSSGARQRVLPGTSTNLQTTVFNWLTSETPSTEHEYVDQVNAPLSRATVIALQNELKSGQYARYKKARNRG